MKRERISAAVVILCAAAPSASAEDQVIYRTTRLVSTPTAYPLSEADALGGHLEDEIDAGRRELRRRIESTQGVKYAGSAVVGRGRHGTFTTDLGKHLHQPRRTFGRVFRERLARAAKRAGLHEADGGLGDTVRSFIRKVEHEAKPRMETHVAGAAEVQSVFVGPKGLGKPVGTQGHLAVGELHFKPVTERVGLVVSSLATDVDGKQTVRASRVVPIRPSELVTLVGDPGKVAAGDLGALLRSVYAQEVHGFGEDRRSITAVALDDSGKPGETLAVLNGLQTDQLLNGAILSPTATRLALRRRQAILDGSVATGTARRFGALFE